ncbi:MAG: biopolymer transporter ExbD [Verrucomicrobiales bacterium]|nr:biopolymer transporter ExbD [Verrucomicrobiales bacterium]
MPRRRTNEEVAFNITPMIDMTFLLLIFFMVTSNITNQQINVPVALPTARSAVDPNPRIERDLINIDGDGNYYIADKPATKEELMAHLRVKFKDYPPLQIYLRADKNTPTKKIREFMDMAAEVGALDVIFGTFTN